MNGHLYANLLYRRDAEKRIARPRHGHSVATMSPPLDTYIVCGTSPIRPFHSRVSDLYTMKGSIPEPLNMPSRRALLFPKLR